MIERNILFILGTLSLLISLYWGISGQQWLEPWTAFLSALLYILGIYFAKTDSNTTIRQKMFGNIESTQSIETKGEISSIEQNSTFSKKSKQRINKQ